MKYLFILAIVISSQLMADGYHYVRPYVRQDGTYVNGHMQGNPDQYKFNNLNYGKTNSTYDLTQPLNNPYGQKYDPYTGMRR